MTIKTVTLHMYAKTGQWDIPGSTDVCDMDFRANKVCMADRIWLGEQVVELDFPDVDINQAKIEALKDQLQQERADSQVRQNLLLDRISKLQAIGYDE